MKTDSSKCKDKQITEFSKSQPRTGFDDHEEGRGGDDQGPSLVFHPIRSLHSSNKPLHGNQLRGWSSVDCIDYAKFSGEKVGIYSYLALISEIDRKMKKHVDVLLHSVECLSTQVSQMESRTWPLENAIDDLKDSIEFNHGKTDGKLRELQNILTEVQGVIQDLRDEQEITGAQLQLAKLKASSNHPQLEKENSSVKASLRKEAPPSISQPSHQSVSVAFPFQSHPPSTPEATAHQFRTQLPQNSIPIVPRQDSYHPAPVPSPRTSHQQYHMLPTQQLQPLSHACQPYHTPPHLPLSSQVPQVHPSSTMSNPQVPLLSHHPEQVPCMPSLGIHKSLETPGRPFLSQQFNMDSAQQIHYQPLNRYYSESTSASAHTQGLQPQGQADFMDSYRYGHSPAHGGGSVREHLQSLSSSPVLHDESRYSRLPTARTLPHAIPTASSVDDGSGSGGSGNGVPVDDVVDKVVAMGFRRDLVRATVKKLTENGQLVDLNAVLDKLMNSG